MKTHIATALEVAGDVAKYDEHAKNILSNRYILAWLLKSTAEELKDFPIEKIVTCIEGEIRISEIPVMPGGTTINLQKKQTDAIIGSKTEDKVPHEGMITYDIRFYVILPETRAGIRLLINVEAQNDFYPGYEIVTRGIFYASRMISAQLNTEFEEPDYNGVKKVYSIWICMNAPDYIGNTLTVYSIQKKDYIGHSPDKKSSYDKLAVAMLYLNENSDMQEKSIHHLLNVVFTSNLKPKEKEKILSSLYHIQVDKSLGREMKDMCNLGEGLWKRGISQGISQGILTGSSEKTKIVVRNMLKRGMSEGDICILAECDKDIIDEVRNSIK